MGSQERFSIWNQQPLTDQALLLLFSEGSGGPSLAFQILFVCSVPTVSLPHLAETLHTFTEGQDNHPLRTWSYLEPTRRCLMLDMRMTWSSSPGN
ncbi:hypothetical protein ATANTOWER_028032 [Ataeniobius toweri]|uniref:Uncharacterized protein n=1 Tax=Ataeniobius toweri TaxID=208326 RepID=A0ABU7BBN1_9TELE|nr:hypothetical protein [Ataeniobius toweri]